MTTQLNFDPGVATTEGVGVTDIDSNNITGNGIVDRWSLDKHIQLAILWVLFTLIVVGNGIVLIAIWLVRHKKSRLNFFITNLAIADLCVGFFNVGTDILDRQTSEFTGGNIACKLYRYVQAYVILASSYQLVALSFDRFFAIVYPMDFTGSGKRSTLLAVGGWLLPCVLAITSAVVFQVDALQSPDGTSFVLSCWPAPLYGTAPWKLKVYTMYVISSFFYIPLILITFCYVTIIVTIWKRAEKMGGPQKIKKSKNTNNRDVAYEGLSKDSNCTMPKHRASSRGLIPKAKVKTIKMTICIVLAYICCFMPFSLFYTLEAFGCIDLSSQAVIMATPVLQNLPSLNSATNPFIYGIFSTNVCKELRRIPAINWIADKVPCCKAWKPLRFGRTTYQTNTHTTEFNNYSDGHPGSRGRNIVSMSGKVVDGPSRDDSRNSTTSPM